MKKNIFKTALIFSIFLLLTACENIDVETEIDPTSYYYYLNGVNLSYYNIISNKSYYLCNLNKCKHNNLECPSYLVWMLTKSNDNIYYVRDEDIEIIDDKVYQVQTIYSYDIHTHDNQILERTFLPIDNTMTRRFEYMNGSLYYYRNNKTNDKSTYDLYEFDISRKKETFIRNDDDVSFACMTKERFFYIFKGEMFYTTKYGSEYNATGIKDVYMARSINNEVYYNTYDELSQKYILYKITDNNSFASVVVLSDAPESIYYSTIIEYGCLYYIYRNNNKYEVRKASSENNMEILYISYKPIIRIDKQSDYIIIFIEGASGNEIKAILG